MISFIFLQQTILNLIKRKTNKHKNNNTFDSFLDKPTQLHIWRTRTHMKRTHTKTEETREDRRGLTQICVTRELIWYWAIWYILWKNLSHKIYSHHKSHNRFRHNEVSSKLKSYFLMFLKFRSIDQSRADSPKFSASGL